MKSNALVLLLAIGLASPLATAESKQLLWGDTHLHTSYSFDAFLNSNHSADPDVAYRYAKGEPVIHPLHRARVQIGTPLDFLVVSDHAEFYGGLRDIYNDGIQVEDPGFIESIAYWWAEREIREAVDSGNGPAYFADQLPHDEDPIEAAKAWAGNEALAPPGGITSATNAWRRARSLADKHYQPGTFTTLLGWEWSTVPGGANLHRVVVTDASGEVAGAFLPFSSVDSPYPEDLWDWLDTTSQSTGANFVAIPHNSNISKGLMFSERTLHDEAMTEAYARKRAQWEPVVEITQIKGDSETHPSLSPDDPFADFEPYEYYIQQEPTREYLPGEGDFIRAALITGLGQKGELGANPFEFGVIGSTDSHTGLASAEEPNFWGKMANDSIPENKQTGVIGEGPTGWTMQAGGLAAVWAEDNTREAILDAFKRREVYATTGPRIAVRMFVGGQFETQDAEAQALVSVGYAKGVPMGGVITPAELQGTAPSILFSALRDANSASLDRVQVIKGWVDAAGQRHERVFDVAWSGEREANSNGDVPAVANTVDLKTLQWEDETGANELAGVWRDPAFDPTVAAFYYLRVLEIPTPRHAMYDALALGLERPLEGPPTIQERAYSSAVWYYPHSGE